MADSELTHEGVMNDPFELARKIEAHATFSRKLGGNRVESFVDSRTQRIGRVTNQHLMSYALGSRQMAAEVALRYLPLGVDPDFLPWLNFFGPDLYPLSWRKWLDSELLRLFEDEQEALVAAAIQARAGLSTRRPLRPGQRPSLEPVSLRPVARKPAALAQAERSARRIAKLVERLEHTSQGLGHYLHETAQARRFTSLPAEVVELVRGITEAHVPASREHELSQAKITTPGELPAKAMRLAPPALQRLIKGLPETSRELDRVLPGAVAQPALTRTTAQRLASSARSPYPAGIGRVATFARMISARPSARVGLPPAELPGGPPAVPEMVERWEGPSFRPLYLDDVSIDMATLVGLSSGLSTLAEQGEKAASRVALVMGASDTQTRMLDGIQQRFSGERLSSSSRPGPVAGDRRPVLEERFFTARPWEPARTWETLLAPEEIPEMGQLALPQGIRLDDEISSRLDTDVLAALRQPRAMRVFPATSVLLAGITEFEPQPAALRSDTRAALAVREMQERARSMAPHQQARHFALSQLAPAAPVDTTTGRVPPTRTRPADRTWQLFSPAKALSLSLMLGGAPLEPVGAQPQKTEPDSRLTTHRAMGLAEVLTEGRHALKDWQQTTPITGPIESVSTPFGRVIRDRSVGGVRAMRTPLVPTDSLVQIYSEAEKPPVGRVEPRWSATSPTVARAIESSISPIRVAARRPEPSRIGEAIRPASIAAIAESTPGVPRALRSPIDLLISRHRLEEAAILTSAEAGAEKPLALPRDIVTALTRPLGSPSERIGRPLSAVGLLDSEEVYRDFGRRAQRLPQSERLLVVPLAKPAERIEAFPTPLVPVVGAPSRRRMGPQPPLAVPSRDLARGVPAPSAARGTGLPAPTPFIREMVSLVDEWVAAAPLATQMAKEVLLPRSVRQQLAAPPRVPRAEVSSQVESRVLSLDRLMRQPRTSALGAAAAPLARMLLLAGAPKAVPGIETAAGRPSRIPMGAIVGAPRGPMEPGVERVPYRRGEDLGQWVERRLPSAPGELRMGGWTAPFSPAELQQLVSLVDERVVTPTVSERLPLQQRVERSVSQTAAMATSAPAESRIFGVPQPRDVVSPIFAAPPQIAQLHPDWSRLDLSDTRLEPFARMESLHVEAPRERGPVGLGRRGISLVSEQEPPLRRWGRPFSTLAPSVLGGWERPLVRLVPTQPFEIGPPGAPTEIQASAPETPRFERARAEEPGRFITPIREIGTSPMPKTARIAMPEAAVDGGTWSGPARFLDFAYATRPIRMGRSGAAIAAGPMSATRPWPGTEFGRAMPVVGPITGFGIEEARRQLQTRGFTPEAIQRAVTRVGMVQRRVTRGVAEPWVAPIGMPARRPTLPAVRRAIEGYTAGPMAIGAVPTLTLAGLDLGWMAGRPAPPMGEVFGRVPLETSVLKQLGRGGLIDEPVTAGRRSVRMAPVDLEKVAVAGRRPRIERGATVPAAEVTGGRIGAAPQVSTRATAAARRAASAGWGDRFDTGWWSALSSALDERSGREARMPMPDLGWLRRELANIVRYGTELPLGRQLSSSMRPKGLVATRNLLDFIEHRREEEQAGERSMALPQMPRTHVAGPRPAPVRPARTGLGRAPVQQRSLESAVSIQGERTAVDREYVAPTGGPPRAPDISIQPLAQRGGATSATPGSSEGGVDHEGDLPKDDELESMAEQILSKIMHELEKAAWREGV